MTNKELEATGQALIDFARGMRVQRKRPWEKAWLNFTGKGNDSIIAAIEIGDLLRPDPAYAATEVLK